VRFHYLPWIAVLSLTMLDASLAQPNDAIRIASFNIHYIVPQTEDEDWEERRDAVTRVLQEMDADIVAFQEMETFDGGHYSRRNWSSPRKTDTSIRTYHRFQR